MKGPEKKLLQIFRGLPASEQATVMRFAQFLAQESQATPKPLELPRVIPRAEDETVVGALKRLSASYPMLDKAIMLNETSSLMAQHVMQGRDKNEVIEELEILFKTQYTKLQETMNRDD